MASRKAAESATGRTSSIRSPNNPSVRPSRVGASLGSAAGESSDGWAGLTASSRPRIISAAHSSAGDALVASRSFPVRPPMNSGLQDTLSRLHDVVSIVLHRDEREDVFALLGLRGERAQLDGAATWKPSVSSR